MIVPNRGREINLDKLYYQVGESVVEIGLAIITISIIYLIYAYIIKPASKSNVGSIILGIIYSLFYLFIIAIFVYMIYYFYVEGLYPPLILVLLSVLFFISDLIKGD